MSVWNAVLQASHSALIDTLNERFPDDKLELGLPKRFNSWGTTDGATHILIKEVKTDEGLGILALGVREEDAKLGDEVFKQMLVRAEKEFGIRKIQASFTQPLREAPTLRMTIWLPIRLLKGAEFPLFDLAVGV